MTREELYSTIFEAIINFDSRRFHGIVDKIWGQPFDGETERINTAKSASSTSLATEDSSVTLSESFRDGTTYTRSYQVFLPTPKPIQTKPIFKTHQ